MHDPMTVAHEIKWPFYRDRWGHKKTFLTIWHVDPETDGSDDSCGWFMRSRHGDRETLGRVIKAFEFDWDRTFASGGKEYCTGFFHPETRMPIFSVMGIALCLFRLAAFETFGKNWKKTDRYIKKNLHSILSFAENPTDSLYNSVVLKFGNDQTREERIRQMAQVIYAYILRDIRPWYKHPRWHIHHWKIQWHFGQRLWRWLFERCSKCGKGYSWGYSPMSNWNGDRTWHHDCSDK